MQGAAPALRWGMCAALSLLIHAAAWWALHPAIGVSGHRHGMGTSPRSRPVTTVTVARQQPITPSPPPTPHPAANTATVTARTTAPLQPAAPPVTPPAQVHHDGLTADTADASEATGTTDDTLFLPSTALDNPPQPQTPIDLQAPENMPDGTFKAQATLFIDEEGRVLRLRVDQVTGAEWPAALEEQVYRTFLAATFAPGEKAGQPVKSQMRIEVEFSTEPPPLAETEPSGR